MSWTWVEYQCYLVPIVYVGNFKTMMNYFIQSELNVVILYVSSRPNSLCPNFWSNRYKPSQSACLSRLVSKGKNNLSLDDLLQMSDDTMLDNSFVDQHRFDYYESNDNKDDETLDLEYDDRC
jgi:hypothetical protein